MTTFILHTTLILSALGVTLVGILALSQAQHHRHLRRMAAQARLKSNDVHTTRI